MRNQVKIEYTSNGHRAEVTDYYTTQGRVLSGRNKKKEVSVRPECKNDSNIVLKISLL